MLVNLGMYPSLQFNFHLCYPWRLFWKQGMGWCFSRIECWIHDGFTSSAALVKAGWITESLTKMARGELI
jgi:hypothetical protein